jgi:hypothetical protein
MLKLDFRILGFSVGKELCCFWGHFFFLVSWQQKKKKSGGVNNTKGLFFGKKWVPKLSHCEGFLFIYLFPLKLPSLDNSFQHVAKI